MKALKEQAQDLLTLLQKEIQANRIILPSLPEVALRVRHLTEDENCSITQLEQEISKDAAITARLLKVANSSALNRGSSVNSLKQAIMNLGLSLVRSLVTQLAILQTMQTGYDQKRLQDFVANSLKISGICQNLAASFKHLDPEMASLAGLLHDIGKLPLRNFLEKQSQLSAQERLQFEYLLHPAAGAIMLKYWNMPSALVVVALKHESILRDPPNKLPDYTDLVITANIIHYGLDSSRYNRYKDKEIPALKRCNININSLPPKNFAEDNTNIAQAMLEA